jgi:hypothetical protein
MLAAAFADQPSSSSALIHSRWLRGMRQVRNRRGAAKRAREAVGELVGGPGVQVPLGGRDVRVAHGGLHARQVDPTGDEQRTVGVPQIVEARRRRAEGSSRRPKRLANT